MTDRSDAPPRSPALGEPADPLPRQVAIVVTCLLFTALTLVALPSRPRVAPPRVTIDAPPLAFERPRLEPPAPRPPRPTFAVLRVPLPELSRDDVQPVDEPLREPDLAPLESPTRVLLGTPVGPPSRSSRPVREGMTGLTPPRLVEEVTPDYPPAAKRTGLEGLVVLEVLVGTDGRVRRVDLVRRSGVDELDQAAVAAAWRRRYEPGLLEGRPVEVIVTIRVSFTLGG